MTAQDREKMLSLMQSKPFQQYIQYSRRKSQNQEEEDESHEQHNINFDKMLTHQEKDVIRRLSDQIADVIDDYEMASMLEYLENADKEPPLTKPNLS